MKGSAVCGSRKWTRRGADANYDGRSGESFFS